MKIVLDQIMPVPLASIQHSPESIWGNFVELNSGQKILLNASSGKGKSTFTLTAVGLRSDYSGVVRYDDRDIRTYTPDDWALIRQQKISVVFQDLQLFPNLTVGENLLIKNSLSPVYTEAEIRRLLERLEIDNKWDQQCSLLSMGQQQRVAIIRAMCQPFEILIMDEPFSHLDEENTQRCLKMINERCDEQNAGFVLTTLGDDHKFSYDKELKL
jgi:ABC-type lipoprotein export system ATPase subunit